MEDIDRFDKKLWAKVIDIEPYFYDEIKRIVKKLITEGKHREALLYLNLAIKKACERGDKELVSLLSDRGICLLNLSVSKRR